MPDPLHITLTLHAQQQCKRRRIQEQEIQDVLLNAESTYPSRRYPERVITLGTTSSGRRLKVVSVVVPSGFHRIITVADRDQDE